MDFVYYIYYLNECVQSRVPPSHLFTVFVVADPSVVLKDGGSIGKDNFLYLDFITGIFIRRLGVLQCLYGDQVTTRFVDISPAFGESAGDLVQRPRLVRADVHSEQQRDYKE